MKALRSSIGRLRGGRWVALGVVAGALAGAVRAASEPPYVHSTARTLSQDLFERGIVAPPRAAFRVSELVVHPPDDKGDFWVTGTYQERGSRGERRAPFKFRAPTPYRPRLAIDAPDPQRLTVRQYLDALAPRVPQAELRYAYAWWERPGGAVALWAAYGLAFGAACAGLATIVGGAREATDAEPLQAAPSAAPRAAPSSVPVAAPADVFMSPVELSVAIPATSPAAAPVPARPLPTEAVEAPAPAPTVAKDFGGQFYPTEVHASRD